MDKRQHKRKDFFARIQIEFADENGKAVRLTGMIEDRSPSGFCINLRRSLEPGAPLTLLIGVDSMEGTVRWCRPTLNGYQVGVEIPQSLKPPKVE